MLVLHGAMLAAPLLFLFAHARFHVNAFGFCAFKAITGLDCPACGITRSAMAVFTGDMILAFRHHLAGPLIVALIALIVTYLLGVVFMGFRGWEWRKEVKAYTGIEVLAMITLLIGWIGKVFMN